MIGKKRRKRRKRRRLALRVWLKRTLLSGLMVLIPLALTFYIIDLILATTDRIFMILPEAVRPDESMLFPGSGILFALCLAMILGFAIRNYVGRLAVSWFYGLVDRIPIVASVHNLLRDIAKAFLDADSKKGFKKVVLVEWPRRDSWMLAFVAAETSGEMATAIHGNGTKEKHINLFIPTTPNPTSGFMFMVKESDVRPLSITVEMAFKIIISAGTLSPEEILARDKSAS